MVMMIYNFVGGPNIASSSGSSNCALGFSTPPPLLSQSPPPLSRSGASNEPNCAITALAATSHWFQSLTDMSLPCRNLTASCEWTMLLRTEPIVSPSSGALTSKTSKISKLPHHTSRCQITAVLRTKTIFVRNERDGFFRIIGLEELVGNHAAIGRPDLPFLAIQ